MHSNSVEEITSKAYDYYIAGNIDEAISYYRQAISQDSDYAPIYVGLALIYGNMYIQNTNDKNLFIFAKKNYEKVMQLLPNQPKVHADLAYILSVNGDFEESAVHYKRALDLGLNNAQGSRLA